MRDCMNIFVIFCICIQPLHKIQNSKILQIFGVIVQTISRARTLLLLASARTFNYNANSLVANLKLRNTPQNRYNDNKHVMFKNNKIKYISRIPLHS